MIVSGRDQIQRHASSLQTDLAGTAISGPVRQGNPSCTGLSQDCWKSRGPCVFQQVMNPSGDEWHGWVTPRLPPAMECIDWRHCYSNESMTANEWLQGGTKATAGNRRGWTSFQCLCEIGERGRIKFVFKLSGGRRSTVEREGGSVTQFYL